MALKGCVIEHLYPASIAYTCRPMLGVQTDSNYIVKKSESPTSDNLAMFYLNLIATEYNL